VATLVVTSYQGNSGLGSGIFVEVRNPTTGAVLAARTNTGVREDGDGFYVWSASLVDLPAYEVMWDENDGLEFGEILVPLIQQVITPPAPGAIVPGVLGPGPSPGEFWIKRGDTCPSLVYQAQAYDQILQRFVPVDLTGATVLGKMRHAPDDAGGLIFSKPAQILDAPNGWLAYNWNDAAPLTDTDIEGTHDFEFEATKLDGCIQTFPTTTDASREYISVHIVPDLDPDPSP